MDFYQFLSAKKESKDTLKTRKPLFPQLGTQFFLKNIFLPILLEKTHRAKKRLSAGKTIFSQVEICYESEGVPSVQMKFSEKKDLQRRKKSKMVFSAIIMKTLSSAGSKSN